MMRSLVLCIALMGAQLINADSLQISPTATAKCVNDKSTFRCVEYVHNYDGDTLTVNIPAVHPLLGKDITVRVVGIDTAEMNSSESCEASMAQKAKRQAAEILAKAKRIDLVKIERDKYFRVLAEVQVDGQSLGAKLIKEKLAVPYDGGHKDPVDWCEL